MPTTMSINSNKALVFITGAFAFLVKNLKINNFINFAFAQGAGTNKAERTAT